MTTTHTCMKTYYVKSRTDEIRPLTTKAYIVPSLRADLISVKSLNRQGYRVVHDPDPEESGIYPIFNLRPPSQAKMRAMLHTSSGSGRLRTLAYTVNSKMFHASKHSVAGHGFTTVHIKTAEGGRRVSTPQERKKQSILDLRPTPAHGHSSFQNGKHSGQRIKRNLMNMCFPSAKGVLLINSKGMITQSISFLRLRRPSNGFLTIACM